MFFLVISFVSAIEYCVYWEAMYLCLLWAVWWVLFVCECALCGSACVFELVLGWMAVYMCALNDVYLFMSVHSRVSARVYVTKVSVLGYVCVVSLT